MMIKAATRRTPTLVTITTLVVAFLGAIVLPSAGQREQFNPPKRYYLALGDSITYGYQAWKADAGLPPSAFNTGYVDVFGARLRQIRSDLTIVNYGCPGESTTTFIIGPCVWTEVGRQLHDPFSGTQLAAALAFLRSHRGQVSPITITLWGNDVREFVGSCPDLECVQNGALALIAQLTGNLAEILAQLRAAAPDAEIIVTGGWDSFLDVLEFADPLFQLLNASMAETAARARARFADPFPVFNPQGDLAEETRAHCTMTLLCTQQDSHPSDIGYEALADLVFEASGYARFR
jgi:lysophospholipase L1-like esterase